MKGRQINGTVPQLCSWDKLDLIRTKPYTRQEEEQKRKDIILRQAEREWKRVQLLLKGEIKFEESAELEQTEGDKVQTCERGTDTKFGRMYTVGTSQCCAEFNCDPTRCVHIINDEEHDCPNMREDGKHRMHTVTIYYEDEKGNSKVHRQTHVHADTEICHHRSCTHLHLPKSRLHLRPPVESLR